MWLLVMKALGALLSTAFVVLYTTPHIIAIAKKLDLIDYPDKKLKNHAKPTPYLGGLVIYLAVIVGLILFYPFQEHTVFFLLGSTLLLFVGLIDDCLPLSPRQKFLGQLIATICFVKGGLFLKEKFLLSSTYPRVAYGLWMFLSSFWMLSVINAFNLIDVMDGLAVTTALGIASSFMIMAFLAQAYSTVILLSLFIGALVGFFILNKPPARMYLGDAGSLFIGAIMATVPFMIPWGTFSWYGYLAPIPLLFVPFVEGTTLIIIRIIKKIPFYQGSRHHFSHFLLDNGWSKNHILGYVVMIQAVVMAVTIFYLYQTISLVLTMGILFLLTALWYSVLWYPFVKNFFKKVYLSHKNY